MSPSSPSIPDASSMRLEVLGKIASGGMGRVDLARNADLDRLVAIKRLHMHLQRDPQFVSMFMDEAWMTAAVDHPNVVPLLGFGRDEEGMFLVMDLVDGPSLLGLAIQARKQGVAMPAELVAYVTLLVARGLWAMHELCDQDGNPLGLVHRDLTPGNVLVGVDGSVCITDFGVAKAAGRTTRTSTDVLKGKTRFLSPEYIRSRQLDARSDLYSLGLTMFVIATCRQPYEDSNSVQVVKDILKERAPKITDFEPDFDPALSKLADELQRKAPADRPQDAAVLQARLEAWIDDAGTSEERLKKQLASFTVQYGKAARDRISKMSRANRETEHSGKASDSAPTKSMVYAQLGPPDEQKTRLTKVRRVPAPEPKEEPESARQVTRLLSRAPIASEPSNDAPPPESVTAVDPPPAPVATAHDSSSRRRSAIGAAIALVAVAAILLIAVISTSEEESDAHAEPTDVTSPDTEPPAAESAEGGEETVPVPTARSSASGAVAPAPPVGIERAGDGRHPEVGTGGGPRAEPSPTSPTVSTSPPPPVKPVQPKPPRPCDPSHFDYPACLSR